MDGLRVLDLVWAHGVHPSPTLQNRLLASWKYQPPENVVEWFVKMKSAGVTLSDQVYRSIVVAHERSNPAFVLELSNEMERSGIQLRQSAYNVVLGVLIQHGMHDAAHELFTKMADHAVAPNARSYGTMIRVYACSDQFEKAITIFDSMREQSFEPDRFAYHHAIYACSMIQRVEYAVELYRDAVQAKVPLCTSTCVILRRACLDVGWKCLASKFEMELTN
mmetsp:Transcript_101329/g.286929  ORF Transcript_101329/g.286929 Transcript_101329/m.286929 type:complete len:221 (-) Transcript_101329:129-791(-)